VSISDNSEYDSQTKSEGFDIKRFNLNAKLGIGIQLPKLNHLSFTLFGESQTLNWGPNRLTAYHYALGFSTGI